MKRKLFIILSTLVLIITLLLSFVFKDNKENNNKISKVEKLLSKPEGIQAYTLNGKKTDISYNDLIEGYEIDSITCKNGTIATYNKEDNSISLSNIHMPDYCTMDFKLGTYTVTIDAGGGYFGNPAEIDDGFSEALTLAKGVSVPVHAGNTLNLTPNQKYMLSFDYWSDGGSVEFDADLFPDSLPQIYPVATTTQQTMNWIFSSSSSDMTSCRIRYFNDRSVPNPQNITIINKHLYKCDDCRLTYTKEITKGNAYGSLTTPKRYGWDFLGWYLEDGTKIDSTSINNIKGNHTVTAKWSHHYYQVKLVGVNGTIEHAPIWYYMAGWEKTFTKLTANNGYTTNGATVSCTGSAGASISGDYLYLSNITEDQTCTVTFKKAGSVLATLIKSYATSHTNGVYNENGYRYEGANPNNYIYMTNKSTNEKELWRIIGVFNDGANGEEVIRVRRHYAKNSYPTMVYDNDSKTAYNYKDINETEVGLLAYNDIINKNYIAAPEIPSCNNCGNHFPNTTIYNTLSSTYNLTNYSHTVNFKMYLGTSSSANSLTSSGWYTTERGNTAGPSANGVTSFIGSVGLMYPSDYGYAVLASDCPRTKEPYNYGGTAACYNNNWLFQGNYQEQWLISPASRAYGVFLIGTGGYVDGSYYSVTFALASSPVMALEAGVMVEGTGTKSDPYTITN